MILFLNAPATKPNRNRKLWAGSTAFIILLLSVWFVLNPSPSASPPGQIARETSWSRAAMMAELMISAIEVVPAVPAKDRPFTVNVFIQNIGIIPSGSYTLHLVIKGPDGREVFRTLSEHNTALEPGQIGAGLSAAVDPVAYSGTYSVTVDLQPENFEDDNLSNNRSTRSFQIE